MSLSGPCTNSRITGGACQKRQHNIAGMQCQRACFIRFMVWLFDWHITCFMPSHWSVHIIWFDVFCPCVSRFHGSSVVDFDSARGGISLETEKTEGGTSSRLMLTRASLRDSGNYTCVPAGAVPASVQVHVLNNG